MWQAVHFITKPDSYNFLSGTFIKYKNKSKESVVQSIRNVQENLFYEGEF